MHNHSRLSEYIGRPRWLPTTSSELEYLLHERRSQFHSTHEVDFSHALTHPSTNALNKPTSSNATATNGNGGNDNNNSDNLVVLNSTEMVSAKRRLSLPNLTSPSPSSTSMSTTSSASGVNGSVGGRRGSHEFCRHPRASHDTHSESYGWRSWLWPFGRNHNNNNDNNRIQPIHNNNGSDSQQQQHPLHLNYRNPTTQHNDNTASSFTTTLRSPLTYLLGVDSEDDVRSDDEVNRKMTDDDDESAEEDSSHPCEEWELRISPHWPTTLQMHKSVHSTTLTTPMNYSGEVTTPDVMLTVERKVKGKPQLNQRFEHFVNLQLIKDIHASEPMKIPLESQTGASDSGHVWVVYKSNRMLGLLLASLLLLQALALLFVFAQCLYNVFVVPILCDLMLPLITIFGISSVCFVLYQIYTHPRNVRSVIRLTMLKISMFCNVETWTILEFVKHVHHAELKTDITYLQPKLDIGELYCGEFRLCTNFFTAKSSRNYIPAKRQPTSILMRYNNDSTSNVAAPKLLLGVETRGIKMDRITSQSTLLPCKCQHTPRFKSRVKYCDNDELNDSSSYGDSYVYTIPQNTVTTTSTSNNTHNTHNNNNNNSTNSNTTVYTRVQYTQHCHREELPTFVWDEVIAVEVTLCDVNGVPVYGGRHDLRLPFRFYTNTQFSPPPPPPSPGINIVPPRPIVHTTRRTRRHRTHNNEPTNTVNTTVRRNETNLIHRRRLSLAHVGAQSHQPSPHHSPRMTHSGRGGGHRTSPPTPTSLSGHMSPLPSPALMSLGTQGYRMSPDDTNVSGHNNTLTVPQLQSQQQQHNSDGASGSGVNGTVLQLSPISLGPVADHTHTNNNEDGGEATHGTTSGYTTTQASPLYTPATNTAATSRVPSPHGTFTLHGGVSAVGSESAQSSVLATPVSPPFTGPLHANTHNNGVPAVVVTAATAAHIQTALGDGARGGVRGGRGVVWGLNSGETSRASTRVNTPTITITTPPFNAVQTHMHNNNNNGLNASPRNVISPPQTPRVTVTHMNGAHPSPPSTPVSQSFTVPLGGGLSGFYVVFLFDIFTSPSPGHGVPPPAPRARLRRAALMLCPRCLKNNNETLQVTGM